MDMQNVSNLQIPEGEVRTIQDSTNRLIWGRLNYDTKYAGDTYQQICSGKNLVDALNVTWIEFNSTLTKTDGVFQMTASSGTLARCCLPLSGLVEGTTYTFSCDIHGVSISSILNTSYVRVRETSSGGNWDSGASYITQTSDYVRMSVTFTATSVSNPYVWFYISASTSNTNNIEIYVKNLQLEAGSTATAYEPYVGGVPAPSPDYPQTVSVVTGTQTITVTGKNLFDRANAEENKLLAWATGLTANEAGSLASDFIPVTPSEELRFTYYAQVLFYGPSKNYIGALQTDGVSVRPSGGSAVNKITVPSLSDIAYMRLGFRASYSSSVNLLTANIQVEKGGVATTYEPYQGQSYTVDLGSNELCKIGNYQDYIYKSGNDWYIHKATGKIVFDGTENWVLSGQPSNYLFNTPLSLSLAGTSSPLASERFIWTGIATPSQQNVIYVNSSRSIVFINPISNGTVLATNVADWKTWLASNNTTVYYPLSTPTDTKITGATLIPQLNSIHQFLTRYGYNATVSGNLPMIIDKTNL